MTKARGSPIAVRRLPRRLAAGAVAASALVVWLAGAADRPLAGDEFIADIEDLPVMPGLSEIDEAGVVFDKPSGRIVEAYATGAVKKGAVLDFYRRTLPQLGWQIESGERFARENEILTLQVREEETGVIVEFRLAPE